MLLGIDRDGEGSDIKGVGLPPSTLSHHQHFKLSTLNSQSQTQLDHLQYAFHPCHHPHGYEPRRRDSHPKDRVVIMLESDATSKYHKTSKAMSEICFLSCFPMKPNCAEGWYAKEMGYVSVPLPSFFVDIAEKG